MIPKRIQAWLLAAVCFTVWGAAATVSSTASDVIDPDKWEVMAFLFSSGYIVGLVGVVIIMVVRRSVPDEIQVNRSWLLVLVRALLSTMGHVGVLLLTGSGREVSLVFPIISLFLVIPGIFGVLFWGEKRNFSKLAGIALCIAAVLCVGFSGSDDAGDADAAVDPGGSSDSWMSTGLMWVIVFVALLSWGFTDIVSVVASRRLHMFTVTIAGILGNSMVAVVSAFVYLSRTDRGSVIEFSTGHLIIFCSFTCSGFAWWLYSYASRLIEASKFTPIVGMHAFCPTVFALVFGGEDLSVMKLVGLVCAVVAVVLIGKPPVNFQMFTRGRHAFARRLLQAALAFRVAGKKYAARRKWAHAVAVTAAHSAAVRRSIASQTGLDCRGAASAYLATPVATPVLAPTGSLAAVHPVDPFSLATAALPALPARAASGSLVLSDVGAAAGTGVAAGVDDVAMAAAAGVFGAWSGAPVAEAAAMIDTVIEIGTAAEATVAGSDDVVFLPGAVTGAAMDAELDVIPAAAEAC